MFGSDYTLEDLKPRYLIRKIVFYSIEVQKFK